MHEPCDLCPDAVIKKEVAQVAGTDDRTFTEAEHLALMADAVTRETASLTDAKDAAEAKVTELSSKVDVLEAEKAALETAKAEVEKAFEDHKAEVERAREIESAKNDRLEKVKAANAGLPDSYFTAERVQRWAEMAEEAFAAFLEDITPLAGQPAKETAAFTEGDTPKSEETKSVSLGAIFAARRGEKN